MASYTITPDDDGKGASIQFPKDRALIDALKAEFPKARWNRERVCWHVPGVRARARLERWAAEHVPAENPHDQERLADELANFEPLDSPIARVVSDNTIRITTPYDPAIISAVKRIPGATWQSAGRCWVIPMMRRSVEALRAALPAIEARAAEVTATQAAEKAAREAHWAAERAERDQARQAEKAAQAERRSRRILYPNSDLPPLDTPIRLGERWVVYTDRGRDFRISEDDPSCFGAHLLGHEGEWGCYCYYREATPEEAAQAEQARAEAKASRAAEQAHRAELRAAWDRIQRDGERPAGQGLVAEGTTIYLSQRDRDGAIYGYGDSLVLGQDWIWAIQNNGSDGADWSANNLRSAIGWHIPTDVALAARLMELARETGLSPDLERADEQARFAAVWTLETTQARRAEWNQRVRDGEFGREGGQVDMMAVNRRIHEQGWTMGDLKRAIKLHNL